MFDIEKLINELTLDEKISLLTGFNSWYSNKIPRLNIPSIKMSDGPNGVRGDSTSNKSSACFPCPISIGSTWNKKLIKKVGIALGEEARDKDVDVLLGPTINLHRHPLGGRHFENFSEDPVLTGKIAVSYVKGVQSKQVSACLKHFVANDTEFERHTVSSNVDERTLREIYLLPFEMGVKKAQAKSVMSAYNKLNNIYCSSNKELLMDILKTEWGFNGYVVSDWGAALETVDNANGGLDMEMPGPGNTWGVNLKNAIETKEVPLNLINDKVKRILSIMEFTGRSLSPENKPEKENNRKSHRKLLKKCASEGMVLLKNENFLPVENLENKKIAIIGPNAKFSQIIGGGSASLKPHYQIHPLEALKAYVSDKNIFYAKGAHTHKYLPKLNESLFSDPAGFKVEYFDEEIVESKLIKVEKLKGNKFWVFDGFAKDIINREKRPNIKVRFSCEYTPDIKGLHEFEVFGIGPCSMKINGKEIIDNASDILPGEAFFSFGSAPKKAALELEKDNKYQIEVIYSFEGRFPAIQFGCLPPDKENLLDEAKRIAKKSDFVILIAGTNSDWETEGNDRKALELPCNQDELITEITSINKNCVVVLNTGSPVSMSWVKKPKAILQSWFGGQEYGNALMEIIFGKTNPSGKLPTTFPIKIDDTPAYTSYPGQNSQMDYEEKLLIGYRWYEKKGIKTLFPFGHGLSYTNFNFESLKIEQKDENIYCRFNVSNIGKFDGKEIIQCYVANPNCQNEEPIKTLQNFKKIKIKKGQTKKVKLKLNKRNFSYWDITSKSWRLKENEYEILIGSSSENIHLREKINF